MAVIIASVVILTIGFELIDPIASAFIGLFILPRTWHLNERSCARPPRRRAAQRELAHIREHILGTENVVAVHDLHVWSMTSDMPVMSAHVVVAQGASASQVLNELCECLEEHFDIDHSTIQIERADRSGREQAAH